MCVNPNNCFLLIGEKPTSHSKIPQTLEPFERIVRVENIQPLHKPLKPQKPQKLHKPLYP